MWAGTVSTVQYSTNTHTGVTGVHLRVSRQIRCLRANAGRYSKYSSIKYKYRYRCDRCSPESVRANQVFEGKCGQVGEGEDAREGGCEGSRVVLNINVR